MKAKIKNSKKGFTLVELVVTIALLAIIAGLSIGVVFNVNNSFELNKTLSYRQQNVSFAEKIINSYIKSGEHVIISNKGSSINVPPKSDREIKICIEEINGENVICIKKSEQESGHKYKFENIYTFTGVEKNKKSKATKLDKAEFNLTSYDVADKKGYKLNYDLWSANYKLEAGSTLMNMNEETEQRSFQSLYDTSEIPAYIELDVNNSNTFNNSVTIVLAEDPRTPEQN